MIAVLPVIALIAGVAACKAIIVKSKSNPALASLVKWLQCEIQ